MACRYLIQMHMSGITVLIGTGQFALNEGQKICKHFLCHIVARLVNPFIGNGFHMVCNLPDIHEINAEAVRLHRGTTDAGHFACAAADGIICRRRANQSGFLNIGCGCLMSRATLRRSRVYASDLAAAV